MKQPAVHSMANKRNGTLNTGVTFDLPRRAYEHCEAATSGFASRYGCWLFVGYERYDSIIEANGREKQIKAGSRKTKLALIEALNRDWRDLHGDLA